MVSAERRTLGYNVHKSECTSIEVDPEVDLSYILTTQVVVFPTSSVSIAHCISKCGTNLHPRIVLFVGLALVSTPAM